MVLRAPLRPNIKLAQGKGIGGPLRTRAPRPETLAFIPRADNPLADLATDPNASNEVQINEELGALGKGLKQRMQQEEERKKEATRTDDYLVVAFASGDQAHEFLRAAGYADIGERIIDGVILAKLLNIVLPEAPKRRLLATHAKLNPLVTKAWRGKREE